MKNIFLYSLLCLFLAATCSNSPASKPSTLQEAASNYSTPLYINNKKILVEIVNTPDKMQHGLSYRKNLLENQGMLFQFEKSQQANFWMKDMNFDIDIIWIQEKKIVGINSNVPAPVKDQDSKINNTNLPTYPSPGTVDMVLEVTAGWSEKNNIKTGDRISF
ncbi:MAG: DUF192 domain-containing protein [Candidatus Doudnabacteria bacterium]|nr:DUF192 domain-containing protein [Candidatus Doudnabacteria bacterium]